MNTALRWISVGLILAISWGITFYVIYGKGIHVTKTYHQEQYQYQNQAQAQITMNWWAHQGDFKINYKFLSYKHNTGEEISEFLSTLSPVQYVLCKIVVDGVVGTVVYYPEMKEEWKKK